MGGCVSVTIRTINGKEHRMCRWTNSLPNFVNNINLINKDEGHLQKYIKVWEDMSNSYNSGDTINMPMSNIYVPNAGLYPTGYGLVLIDYQTNTILTSQSYSSLGTIGSSEAGLAKMGRYQDKEKIQSEEERISDLFKRAKEVILRDLSERNIEDITLEEFSKYGSEYMYALLDMSPWTIKDYLEDEIDKMLEDILEMGFVLNDLEHKGWIEFMKYSS